MNTQSNQRALTTTQHVFRFVLELGVDYLRWTQLIPMIFAWAFMLTTVVAILLINFQNLVDELIVFLWPYLERWGLLTETEQLDGDVSISLSGDEIKKYVYRGWFVLAAIGYLLGKVTRLITGPKPPKSLGFKLKVAAIAAALVSMGYMVAWSFGSEEFTGSTGGWFAMFIIAPALVWVISAYSLSVGHALEYAKQNVVPRMVKGTTLQTYSG